MIRATASPAKSSRTCAPIWATRSTRPSSLATSACPKRPRTASPRCSTISNAPAAKPISSSRRRSFAARIVGAPPDHARPKEHKVAEDVSRTIENRPRLGRGLAALLGGTNAPHSEIARGARQTPIEFLRPNPRNPRKRFDDAELDELAASIKERGIIQPVVVRAISGVADAYEIIAGERGWRAAQRAGLHEIPVIVVEAGDREALEIAIVENVQRADLNALEEAAGYAQLGETYGYSHGDIARVVSKSRSHVANTLRLAGLPEHTRSLLAGG